MVHFHWFFSLSTGGESCFIIPSIISFSNNWLMELWRLRLWSIALFHERNKGDKSWVETDYKRFQNRILELERNNEEYLVDDIVEFKKKKNHRSYLLMQYIETQISYKKKMGKDGIAAAYHSTYISLKKYIGMKSARKSDIRMEEINFSFVVGYEDFWMHKDWRGIRLIIICVISGRFIIPLSGMDLSLKARILLLIFRQNPARL